VPLAGNPAVDERRRAGESESAQWVRRLQGDGPGQAAAVRQLHAELLRVARSELRRRSPRTRIAGSELDDLAHQAAADAIVVITRKLDQFRYESRFTTWAYRFVILEVSNKLGRHFWRAPGISIDQEQWDRLPAAFGLDPQRQAEWQELIEALRAAIEETLTPHQRRLFVAIVLNGVSLDAMVAELGSNRNAIYKALFDARRKLRRALVAGGHMDAKPERAS
jgi:RNA polymerase sigma-70 factor, ECF subfamily